MNSPWMADEIFTEEELETMRRGKDKVKAKTKINIIVSAIAELESKKSQVKVGDLREILACLQKLSKDPAFYKVLTVCLAK